MKDNNELIDHLEKVRDDFLVPIDKIPMEDKLIMSREEELEVAVTLEPWEISEIVQSSLKELPQGLEGHAGQLFDVVYDAISEALDRVRG